MRPTTNVIIDSTLILGGAGLSTLFISTDGNGQNPFPIAIGILLVVLVTGLVTFALAWFVRTLPLTILGSVAITDLVFFLYFVCRVAFSRHVDEHAQEELYLLPLVFAVVTAPTVILSSVGFGRFASRAYKGKNIKT